MKSIFGIELETDYFRIFIQTDPLQSLCEKDKWIKVRYYHNIRYVESGIPKKILENFFDHPTTQQELQYVYAQKLRMTEKKTNSSKLHSMILRSLEKAISESRVISPKEIRNIITMHTLSQ